jgi:hypothetical protein
MLKAADNRTASMNLLLFVLLLLLASGATTIADDFRTLDGKKYINVKISRVEPDGIMVVTDSGIIKLFFTELPKEIQEKYHYDPKKAEAFRFRLDAARDAAAEEVAAAKERRHQEYIRNAEAQRHIQKGPEAKEEQSERVSALSLDAHEIGTADGFRSYWETDWGSYDRDYARGKRILVTIHDFSRKIQKCEINVYFIARPLFTQNVHFIYDRKRFFPELRGRIEVSGPVGAADLHARILNLAALGERYGNGADMDGWIVVGKLRDRVFGIRASSQTLLEIAEASPRQAENLAKMIADYERATR